MSHIFEHSLEESAEWRVVRLEEGSDCGLSSSTRLIGRRVFIELKVAINSIAIHARAYSEQWKSG